MILDNNSTKNIILIPYSVLFDIEYGMIMLIKYEYNNSSVFNDNINQDEDTIKKLLINREDINPLKPFCNDNVSDEDMDSLYNEIMDTKYLEIIEYSTPTKMIDVVNAFKMDNNLIVNIRVLSDSEREKIIDVLGVGGYNIVTNEIELSNENFNTFFISAVNDINFINIIEDKPLNIYIANYNYNTIYEDEKLYIDEKWIDKDNHIFNNYKMTNISIFSPYPEFDNNFGEKLDIAERITEDK